MEHELEIQAEEKKDDIDLVIENTPILEPVHRELIRELPNLAKVARIPPQMVYEPLGKYCSGAEKLWLKTLRIHPEQGIYGLWYKVPSGVDEKTIPVRMQAMAAACLRNYIDARVMTMPEVVNALSKDTMPEPTVLLIPNFWDGWLLDNAGHRYKAERLSELLLQRQLSGLMTVIQAEDPKTEMWTVFGKNTMEVLGTYFII